MKDRNDGVADDGLEENTSGPHSQLFPPSATLQARVVFGEVTYFALTAHQVETYTALGRIVTASWTVLVMLAEAAFGCWLALKQGMVSQVAGATIGTVMWIILVACVLLAVSTGIYCWLREKNRRGWLVNTVNLQQ